MAPPLSGLDRPIAVAGFMAAGKSTVGRLLAQRLGRPFADGDAEVERRAGCSVRALFERDGEAAFRALEATVTRDLLLREDAPVIALGGGALVSEATRALRARARVLRLARRAVRDRLGARRRAPARARWPATAASFEQLGARRAELYRASADAIVAGDEPAEDMAGALAQLVWTRAGIAGLALEQGAVAIVDPRARARARPRRVIELAGGEEAKSPAGLERLWRALAARELERSDVVAVPAAARSPTSAASRPRRSGAACRGSPCPRRSSARSTPRSAARRRSTSRPRTTWARSGSPRRCSATRVLLETLPAREWAGGMAEVVKTALLAGGRLWELVERWEPGMRRARPRARSSCSAARASRRSSWRPTRRSAGAARSSTSATRSATGSRRSPATAASRTASASRSASSPRCASRRRIAGLEPGTAERAAQLLARHGLPVTRARASIRTPCWRAMRHDKKRTAGTHRMVLLEASDGRSTASPSARTCSPEAVRAATAPPH